MRTALFEGIRVIEMLLAAVAAVAALSVAAHALSESLQSPGFYLGLPAVNESHNIVWAAVA